VPPQMMDCPQCRQRKPTHTVCPNCGTYNGMDVLRLETKAKQKPE
jgi:large subunit ribosomal protein L32